MPTTSTKGKPVLAGTDAFNPQVHINNAVDWAETFANVRNVADSTAMNALSGNDVWVGLSVFHLGGSYPGSVWTCTATSGSPVTGTWKRVDTYALPDPVSAVSSLQNVNVTATAWGTAVPNGQGTLSVTLPSAAWVRIDLSGWISLTTGAGDVRVGVVGSGATTINAPSSSYPTWSNGLYTAANASASANVQSAASLTVKLNAGTTLLTLQAYKTGSISGTYVNYTVMTATPLRWAN
jgi:hypothetical protein